MEEYVIRSAVEVANDVQNDIIQNQGISLAQAARRIGKSPQNFYNMLAGKSRFSKRTAVLLNKEFGYSVEYLTQGIGTLIISREDEMGKWTLSQGSDDSISLYGEYNQQDIQTLVEKRLSQAKLLLDKVYHQIAGGEINDNTYLFFIRDAKAAYSGRIKPEDYGYKYETPLEMRLFTECAVWLEMIMQLLDPGRVREAFEGSRKEFGD